MKKNDAEKGRVYWTYLILIYALAAIGRAATIWYETCCTDVALSQWIAPADYLSEILVSGRVSLSIAAVVFAIYCYLGRKWNSFLLHAILASGVDYLFGFLLHQPFSVLSAIQQVLNFLLEAAILLLACLAAYGMNRKYQQCETTHDRRKYSMKRANTAALAIPLLLHFLVKAWDIVGFLRTYTGITNTEIAHMTGDGLRVLFIYGGLAVLIAEMFDAICLKNTHVRQDP